MSQLLFLFCSCLAGIGSTRTTPELFLREDAEQHFELFIQKHDKQYADENEKRFRFQIFIESLERANFMNQQSDHAVFGITQFSDLTPDEFVNRFTSLSDTHLSNLTSKMCKDVVDSQIPEYNAPESFDWRQQNVVTRVKNQYKCEGCYAFSASGNIESQYAIRYGKLIELSEQQTVDCDRYSNGCRGGAMTSAFRSIIQLGGIELESDYPYVGIQQRCKFTPGKAMVRLTDCKLYNVVSQEKVKQLLYKFGPISIGVQSQSFQQYHGGIMTNQACNVGRVNHAVLLVGYGTENGIPYWIVKNSWGISFGEEGYIRIQRGEGASSCGMINNGYMSSSIIM